MPIDFETFCARTGAAAGVLVIAPHPDDECAGTGGLLALCAEAGIAAGVVFVTGGGASHPNSSTWPPRRLIARRRAEAAAAAAVLGIGEPPLFLGLPDASTPGLPDAAHLAAVATLSAVLARRRPGLVLTTWRREPHGDHRYAYRLARDAVAGSDARLAEYLVWTPITGLPEDRPGPDEAEAVILDVAGVRDRKRRALDCYGSQLGRVVRDDPEGFVLTTAQFGAMTGPAETYLM